MRFRPLALSVGALALLAAPNAHASDEPPGPRFGDPGQLVISSDANASIFAQLAPGDNTYVLQLSPAVDVFVARHLSVGAGADFSYQATTFSDSSADRYMWFGIAPRVGYDIPLSDHVSLWPKLGTDVGYSRILSGPVSGPAGHGYVSADLFIPVLFHPVPHFFVGFGPYADATLTNPGALTFGAKLTVGGWAGL
jgi:hypothetical protein